MSVTKMRHVSICVHEFSVGATAQFFILFVVGTSVFLLSVRHAWDVWGMEEAWALEERGHKRNTLHIHPVPLHTTSGQYTNTKHVEKASRTGRNGEVRQLISVFSSFYT